MRTHGPFTTKQVVAFWFTRLLDAQDEPTARYRCRCGCVRKQEDGTGYSNTFGHVASQHPDFVAVMTAAGSGSETLVSYIDRRSLRAYSWLDLVVECNLPFSMCENPTLLKYLKQDGISVETLQRYMARLTSGVECAIADFLPEKFGILFDGWTSQSEHYVAVLATFPHDGTAETVLLAMTPLLADDESVDHSADSHVPFLNTILTFYGKRLDSVAYIVGDNCSVNCRLADLLRVPLVGCASHRLNLAVVRFMADFEAVLDKVQILMRKLRALNAAAKLREKTSLRPVLRQATRWSSTFAMVDRYFKLKPFLNQIEDDELDTCALTRREEAALSKLLGKLKDLESASKRLQGSVTLLEVRDLFDALMIERYPSMAHHLAADAEVVKSPVFEAACVAVLAGRENTLTFDQHEALAAFRAPSTRATEASDDDVGFAERVLREKKRARVAVARYRNVDVIPPTSNVVERFFSSAKMVLGQHRQAMLPANLENVLFLKMNRRFWNAAMVADVLHAVEAE